MEASTGHQKDFERELSLLTFVKPWLCTAHWANCFSYIVIFTLPINSMKTIPPLSPFPRWGNRGLAKWSSFPKVTQRGESEVGIWTQDCFLSESLHLTSAPKAESGMPEGVTQIRMGVKNILGRENINALDRSLEVRKGMCMGVERWDVQEAPGVAGMWLLGVRTGGDAAD